VVSLSIRLWQAPCTLLGCGSKRNFATLSGHGDADQDSPGQQLPGRDAPDSSMNKRILCTTLLMVLGCISAQAQSHVAEPSINLGDTSFLDAIGGPGFLFEQINDIGRDGRIVNSSGQTVPGSGSVNSISGLTHVAWLAHKQILGGWYGIEVIAAAAYVDAGAQGQRGGFGDLTVGPLILQWPEHRLFGMPIDQRVTADFGIPVG
jgi:hypothetical protein